MESEIEELCRGVIAYASPRPYAVELQRLKAKAEAILASQIPLTALKEQP